MNNLQSLLLAVVFGALALCAAATTDTAPQPEDPDFEPVKHKVLPGDTLQSVAAEFYADPEQWQRILDANPNIKNEDTLEPGTVLIIPPPDTPNDPNDESKHQVTPARQPAPEPPADPAAEKPADETPESSNIGPGGIEWDLVTRLQIDCIDDKAKIRKTPVTYYCDSMDMVFVHIKPSTDAKPSRLPEPGFYIAATEVTRQQWRNVTQPKSGDLKPADRDLPVSNVSWRQAVEFCKTLSQTTGRYYRLPTQIEWEYACRAGTATKYYCGDTISSQWANFRPSTGVKIVGGYPANLFGIYDTHGNVSEWCLDEHTLGQKFMRGGSFRSFPQDLACSQSAYSSPADKSLGNGFRLLLEIEQ